MQFCTPVVLHIMHFVSHLSEVLQIAVLLPYLATISPISVSVAATPRLTGSSDCIVCYSSFNCSPLPLSNYQIKTIARSQNKLQAIESPKHSLQFIAIHLLSKIIRN